MSARPVWAEADAAPEWDAVTEGLFVRYWERKVAVVESDGTEALGLYLVRQDTFDPTAETVDTGFDMLAVSTGNGLVKMPFDAARDLSAAITRLVDALDEPETAAHGSVSAAAAE